MRQQFYPHLLSLLLALTFLACEKEAVTIEQQSAGFKLTPEQQFDNLAKPLILYQFSSLNLESGEESGWIIDRQGFIKKYRQTVRSRSLPSSDNETWAEAEIANLYALSTEIVGEIAIEELLNRFHQSLSVDRKFLSSTTIHQNETQITAFYAYTLNTPGALHNNQDWCKNDPQYYSQDNQGTQIKRMILHMSGYFKRYETSNVAIDLHNWLQEINALL